MNETDILKAIGGIEEKYIYNAQNEDSKMQISTSIKWLAIAACLCVTAVIAVYVITSIPRPGSGYSGPVTPGGAVQSGLDPKQASYVICPYYANIDDVTAATYAELTEDEACSVDALNGYYPAYVAEGYHFKNAGLYETTMSDGTKYYMLRMDYTAGTGMIDDHENYSLQLTAFEPQHNDAVLTIDTIPEDTSSFFYVKCGDVYVGVNRGELSYDEMIRVLRGITKSESYGCLDEIISAYGFPFTLQKLGGQDLLYFTINENSAERSWSMKDGEKGNSFYDNLSWRIEDNRLIISGDWEEEFIIDAENMRAVSQKDGKRYRIWMKIDDDTYYGGPDEPG